MKKANQISHVVPFGTEVLPTDQDVNKYLSKIKRKEVKIIFFGSDSFVVPVLEALEANFEVVAVITTPDSPISKHFSGPILTPDKLDSDFLNTNYQLLATDLFVVASYGKIIPQAVLDIPKFGGLNIHPSLLPKYRGPSPIPETILSGDKTTGVTIIKMDEKMDHGEIVIADTIELSGQETFEVLSNKLFVLGAKLLVKIIPEYTAGKVQLKTQDHEQATFTKFMTKELGFFNITTPPGPENLDRMIRAYYPWPGVWTVWNNRIVKFLPARNTLPEAAASLQAGSHSVAGGPNQMIQMEGKKAISLKDFLNGYPDFPLRKNQ